MHFLYVLDFRSGILLSLYQVKYRFEISLLIKTFFSNLDILFKDFDSLSVNSLLFVKWEWWKYHSMIFQAHLLSMQSSFKLNFFYHLLIYNFFIIICSFYFKYISPWSNISSTFKLTMNSWSISFLGSTFLSWPKCIRSYFLKFI
jgi:hypothetical protein